MATFTPEGEGFADEGWIIKPAVISAFCTEFGEALFWSNGKIQLTTESLVSIQN